VCILPPSLWTFVAGTMAWSRSCAAHGVLIPSADISLFFSDVVSVAHLYGRAASA
jgi:hypothetical protein